MMLVIHGKSPGYRISVRAIARVGDYASPEAAEGGNIALVEDGDTIEIDIPNRRIHLAVSDDELARRRAALADRLADRLT